MRLSAVKPGKWISWKGRLLKVIERVGCSVRLAANRKEEVYLGVNEEVEVS